MVCKVELSLTNFLITRGLYGYCGTFLIPPVWPSSISVLYYISPGARWILYGLLCFSSLKCSITKKLDLILGSFGNFLRQSNGLTACCSLCLIAKVFVLKLCDSLWWLFTIIRLHISVQDSVDFAACRRVRDYWRGEQVSEGERSLSDREDGEDICEADGVSASEEPKPAVYCSSFCRTGT